MPSGTEAAQQKMQEGIDKTRRAADRKLYSTHINTFFIVPSSRPEYSGLTHYRHRLANAGPAGTNPKLGNTVSKLATGDTEASNWTAKGGPLGNGTSREKEPGGL
ncbi:hypothetical protein TruAng_001783 [Truncatella angustata]|nr:hypothetical protein TruAng_001783 [Truncatella angustata]